MNYEGIKQLFSRNQSSVVTMSDSFRQALTAKPNDFAAYWPHVEGVNPFSPIKSVIVKVPLELIVSIYNSDISQDEFEKLNDYFVDQVKSTLDLSKPIFVKTGDYSDKFDFSNPLIQPGESLAEHAVNVMYGAAMTAGGCDTFVFREYITSTKEETTIYNGMPLRRELRWFVDFDNKEILGFSNYWHEKYMTRLVGNDLSVDEAYEEARNKLKDGVAEWKKEKLEDYINWYYWHLENQSIYRKLMYETKNQVEYLVKNATLTGKWSVDVMEVDSKHYLIDMAKMEQSALVDVMEIL